MKKVKIDDITLMCPECKYNNLHQDTVAIFNCEEDRNEGTHVEVDGDKIHIDKSMKGNPSPRRHGLSIHFWCETCGEEHPGHILNIYQHKGETHMGWENK